MPVSMTIPDIPDDAADELAQRAAGAGLSLQEYLRGQLAELARRPSRDALWDLVQYRVLVTGSRLSGDAILELGEAGRG